MVLMHRKDIIERYGVDPAENSGVVPKNEEGPTAAVNVVPDDKKIEAPTQETPHAPVGSNMLAGAFKNYLSDPMMLYGLGAGALYWAKKGGKEGAFAEGLYSEGGLDNVKAHLDAKKQQLRQDNPDWNDELVAEEAAKYTATPEFFDFNTSQMTPALRNGLRMAYDINKKTGVDKTPNQEGFTDDMLQTLGGVLTPGGFLKLGKVAEQYTTKLASKVASDAVSKGIGRAAGVAGNVIDWTVVPGTSNFSPGHIAGNVAGGAALDEVMRHATGDPTVTSGEALNEFVKDRTPLPDETPVVQPSVDPKFAALLRDQTQEAGFGVLGAAAGAALLGRHVFRGRVDPTVVPDVATSTATARQIRLHNETGLNNYENVPLSLNRVTETGDLKANVNAPLEQLGRQLGVEQQLQNEIGQFLSPHGQQLTFKNVWEDGVLPDGTRTTPLSQRYDIIASADEATRLQTEETLKAHNILGEYDQRSRRAANEVSAAQQRLAANPTDRAAIQALQDAHDLHQRWQSYDPSIRRYEPQHDLGHWRGHAGVGLTNPAVNEQLQNFAQIVDTVNTVLRQGGIISEAELRRRRAENPYHIGLFDYDSTIGQKYDPTQPRNQSIGTVTQPVFEVMSPFSSAKASIDIATRAASNNIGRANITHILLAADPGRQDVRVVPHGENPDRSFGGFYTFRDINGREVTIQTARPSVANAIKQAPIDDGVVINVMNSARNIAQQGMVHFALGTIQAPVSMFYNMATGYFGQKAGTSIGYLSRWTRTAGRGNPLMERAADLVDMVDVPGRVAAYGVTAGDALILRTAKALGAKMAVQAITQDGFFGVIARTIPNGEQVVARFGAALGGYHAASWMAHYDRWVNSGARPAIFDRKIFMDQVNADIRKYARGTPRGVVESVRSIYEAYTAVLGHVGELHNMTQVAQNYAIEQARRGRLPNFNETRVLAEQARVSAGDMSAEGGGTFIRRYGKVMPFGRISVQSFRYLVHALTSRGPWDSGLVATRFGAVAGAMYGAHKMIEEMDMKDWYYEQLNDFERNGKIPIPKMQLWVEKFTTGRMQSVDRVNPENNFYMLPLPQEASLFMGTLMYGLELAGYINRGSNRGNTSKEKDLIFAATQTLNVGNIPGIAPLFNAMGFKFDPSNAGRGRNMMTEIKGSKAQYGDMPSGIPSPVAETIKSLMGYQGQMLVQSLDAGIQDYKHNHDAVSAIHRGWDEAKGMWLDKAQPLIGDTWGAKRKHYGFDAMSAETTRQMKVAKDLEDAYSNEFTRAGAMRGDMRRRITDPQVKEMLAATHAFYERGGLPKLQERVNLIRNQVDNAAASKGKLDYRQVQQLQEQGYKEMKPWFDRMNDVVQKHSKYLASRYGDRLQAEGLEPTVDSVVQLVRKYSR